MTKTSSDDNHSVNIGYEIRLRAIENISKFCQDLISKRQYDSDFDYYEEMMISSDKMEFIPTKLNKDSWLIAIKPEYKDLLQDFANNLPIDVEYYEVYEENK